MIGLFSIIGAASGNHRASEVDVSAATPAPMVTTEAQASELPDSTAPAIVTGDETKPTQSAKRAQSVAPKPSAEPKTSAEPKAAPEPKTSVKPKAQVPTMTASQEQAVGAAEDYLSYQAFSRQGLIQQLSSKYGSGFPKKDAIFAVDHIQVNWKDQAAKAAENYLEYQHFSRSGLIKQLESKYGSGFTHEQAVYGVNKAGL